MICLGMLIFGSIDKIGRGRDYYGNLDYQIISPPL